MIATTPPATAEWREAEGAEGTDPGGTTAPPGRRTPWTTGRRTLPRLRRPSTPSLLRLGMALAVVPVAVFAIAVQVGVARNDSTVRTVGRDATRGITSAQALKLNLAELDALVVQDLLGAVTLTASGFPEDYNAKRSELNDNLVLAALRSQEGEAYQQPLANIDYVLAHYHTLVKDAFAARADGDTAAAAAAYVQAHAVMADTLLPEADFVDKANTYVLNNTYDTQTARSHSTRGLIVVTWVLLIGFLVLAQLLLARKFRRLLNVPLVLATVVGVVAGSFAITRMGSSGHHLGEAREQAFDSVHVLARARSTVVSARQSEGLLLLDPAQATAAQEDFTALTNLLFRVQGSDDVGALARAGTVPDGAGGYLATVAGTDDGGDEGDDGGGDGTGHGASGQEVVMAYGEFLAEDANIRSLVGSDAARTARGVYDNARTFTVLSDAIDDAQTADQATFDGHARRAAAATSHVDEITLAAAGAVLLLALLGFYLRLREYGA
jgi:hypothetical protein